MQVTDRDQQLLALLKVNARESVSDLARQLGLSRSTVQDRIRRLEQGGVIAGYSVVLSPQSQPTIQAVVMLEVAPKAAPSVMSALKGESTVATIHTVSGKYDLMALVAVNSMAQLDQVLDSIWEIDGIIRTESAIILSTKLDRR